MNILALETLGLTQTESTLYTLLLKLGEVPVGDIIRESGFKRPTVYKALYSLEAKGLASSRDLKKKVHFKPESPAKLAEQIEGKYAEALQVKNTLSAIIPSLLSAYTLSTERPIVQIYEGVEGIKKIYMDTLEERKDIYAALQTSEVDPDVYSWLESYYGRERTRLGIHAHVIVASGKWSDEYREKDSQNLRTTRQEPSEKFPFEHELNIYGDKVTFIAFKKDEPLIGIIIKNQLVANTMKALFDLAWAGSQKYSVSAPSE